MADHIDDYDYLLPPELIAQHPAIERVASRLLRLSEAGLEDRQFRDLPSYIAPGDLLVFNDTQVIKARLYGAKDSGGRIELLVERIVGSHVVLAHVRASHAPKTGTRLRLADAFDAIVLGREDDLYRLRFEAAGDALTLLERHGAIPLPPYIEHGPAPDDERRYQTVYARAPGAVAAPTAGLHFDALMLRALKAQGVELAYLTLHVGAGTFQPLRGSDIDSHKMHHEWFDLPSTTVAAITSARARGDKVVAVGTTSLRALESAARDGTLRAGAAETDLFIRPGFEFRVVDRLLTNFHLPKSTLLMLIAAFAGLERVHAAYTHAIAERYRFFSYGDAMLIDRIAPA